MKMITKDEILVDVEVKNFCGKFAPVNFRQLKTFNNQLTKIILKFVNLGYDEHVKIMQDCEAAEFLGRKGGEIGGKKRAQILSPERRKEIAKLAANKRWKNDL